MAEKSIRWVGSSYDDLLGFPASARRIAGFELGKIQSGLTPDDWKPFASIGAGVREIRIRDRDGAYRLLYVAKFEEAVYFLHCFQKKTQATAQYDVDLGEARYRAVVESRRAKR